MGLPAVFARYRRDLDGALRAFVGREQPQLLYRMVRYHLGWEDAQGRPSAEGGGKGLRPLLCLLACEAVGGEWRRALPAAVAVELVHNFSLVHDDIQDRDRERRHRPTVWSIWGEGQAINAGDALLALARLAVLRLADEGVPAGKVVEAARILDEATLEMVEGQALDLSLEGRLDVDLPAYLEMIEKKTGALFGCALGLGALVGTDDTDVVEALSRSGRLLGVAFQVRDDVLGVWGVRSRTGKASAADIQRRKLSLPVVYGLRQATGPQEAEELRQIYSQPRLSAGDVSKVVRYLDSSGAEHYCRRMAEERKREALALLDTLNLKGEAAAQFREVATFLLERDF